VKNYKNILIAGAITVGLYLFLHSKKIIPMTHPAMWRDMTPAQRAAYTQRTTLTTVAEKIKALKEARKQKSADENTPLGETTLSPEEQEAVILSLEAEKEQGTGFDYVREKTHPTPAISTAKKIAEKLGKKIAEEAAKKIAKKVADKKAAAAAVIKKITKKIPEASTPAARRKIAEKKRAAAAAAADKKAADKKAAAKKIAEKIGKKIAEEAAKKIAKKLADKKAADEKKRADDKKKAKEALDKLVHDIFNPFYHLGRTEKKTKI